MKADAAHAPRCGIVGQYEDALGRQHHISPATRRAILKAMDMERAAALPLGAEVRVIQPGRSERIAGPAELILEDGTVLRVGDRLPPDLPPGYHQLRSLRTGGNTHLIVSSGRCYLPADLQTWGWAVQLYALRSGQSWGIGDLADLRRFARWSAREAKAGFLLLNPLGATAPVLPQEPSPYFPSSRRYRSPLYLRVEELPGASKAGVALKKLAAAGRALNDQRFIDRDTIFRLKMQALKNIWAWFRDTPGFERFCSEEGEALKQFATFCALAEQHGAVWRDWPVRFRHPPSAAVSRFAEEQANDVRFYQWLQWLLDAQLAKAGKELSLIHDLPVGFDPAGADAWAWQELLATDVTVGAPPDAYNVSGQNWGLPPFVPHKLRAAGYEPFRQTLRAALRHASGLRIDHVMGLFRLFWIPRGAHPREGAFVRYRVEELLAILAIESQRARAVVVGEDLGTVERGVRAELRRRKMLSYRLLWFEPNLPARYPRQSLAAVTTHDLFTVAGLWTGSDLEAQRKLGLNPNIAGTKGILKRLRTRAGLKKSASPRETILRSHKLLARSPCMLLTATLEDALGVEERPNMPGTTSAQSPNWSLALPRKLEAIQRDALVQRVARSLARRTAADLKDRAKRTNR